jgi:tetratricopeptide (TPR) repeat protein
MKGVLEGRIEVLDEMASRIASAIVNREVDRARAQPMPTLETYTLLMAAVSLMHRLSKDDFILAKTILEELVERAPRHSSARAWLANWYTFKVQQGWSSDLDDDARLSDSHARRALDLEPQSSLALTVSGLVATNFKRDYGLAERLYDDAISANPNDSFAWLLRGAMFAVSGQGNQAVGSCAMANKLSPVDPISWLYESLYAWALFVAGDVESAIEIAEGSLAKNKLHASTLRLLIAANWYAQREAEARRHLDFFMQIQPNFTIESYRNSNPTSGSVVGRKMVAAFRALGVREN